MYGNYTTVITIVNQIPLVLLNVIIIILKTIAEIDENDNTYFYISGYIYACHTWVDFRSDIFCFGGKCQFKQVIKGYSTSVDLNVWQKLNESM